MSEYFIELKLILPGPFLDLFGNFLVENGCKGYIIEDEAKGKVVLKGYLKERSRVNALVKKISRYADSLNKINRSHIKVGLELNRIKEENWSKKWREAFKPIMVTDDMVIKPSWVKKRFLQKTVIELEPKMAFGTGEHSTTRLCLKALDKYISPKDKIMDLGTGSGILAIASAKLGASRVLALDIDSGAIANARENIAKNKVRRIVDLRRGTLDEKIPGGCFDIVVANLTRAEVIKLFDKMSSALKKDGLFILSGIQKKERKNMEEFLSRKRLCLKQVSSEKDWVCFVAQKVKK